MRTHHVAVYVLAALLTRNVQAGDSTSLAAVDVAAVRSVDAAYVEAVMAADWTKLANLLTLDAVVMPPNEKAVVGREANLNRFQAFKFESVQYAHRTSTVGGQGSLAYLHGTYTIRVTFHGSSAAYEDTGKYLWVLRKQAKGPWLIERIMWNSDVARSAG